MLDKMTRYIWCHACYDTLIRKKGLKIHGIAVVFHGLALEDYLCDHCADRIAVSDACYAITFVDKASDHGAWEGGYLSELERIEPPI